MTRTAAAPARRRGERGGVLEIVVLALLAYVPFLLSSPGEVSADTKQYLYLDPGRFLARAPYLWDPHVAAGTVPHQQIGYLFPMGPWFWLLDRVGVPDWVAQRLWLGTISLAAVLGARWLFRMLGIRRFAALAGALVYLLTPYQLAFTARISVLLLPWAALPWLIGLTMRATRRGGWRDPALFALVVLTIGAVNTPALLLVGVGPAVWVVMELGRGRELARAALAAAGRIVVLCAGVAAWWVTGLRLQGAYGLPVLQLTENVQTVSSASTPVDLLRGLGNWFFYGHDLLGYSIDQALSYTDRRIVVIASFAIPVLALLVAAAVRWRHRAYFAALVVVGVVIGVGAWPYDDPSPYGSFWKDFANHSSLGLALRNTPRIGPLVVLGLAGLLAAFVSSLTVARVRAVAAAGVVGIAVVALLPVWQDGFLTESFNRPEHIPRYWQDAIATLDRESHATRVLEIPGASFAAYRWGNTVEPVTPGLTDRPYLAREVLPYGSPPSVNLLDALDRRIQDGSFEPSSLAPVARLFGVGTVVLRSDLQYERFDTPRPRRLWADLTDPAAPGLGPPRGYGTPKRNQPAPPTYDARDLGIPNGAADPPPVALFPVDAAVPIVHTAPVREPVVLAGDGDGIVDAAAASLLDGRAQVLELAALDAQAFARALDHGAALVLTDSNRKRIESWFSSIKDTKGATERSDQTLHDPNGYDERLDVFPGSGDRDRTVVEQLGGTVDATADGGPARPEDRAVYAFDGDLRTSWRVGGADPVGERITVRPDRPVRTGTVTLVQPQDGPRDRVVTRVRLRFDRGAPVDVTLGPASLTPQGQVVHFPRRTIRTFSIEILATSRPPFDPALANAVGFAEVRLGAVRVAETVRLPVDLAAQGGPQTDGHSLDVVMTRLRLGPGDPARQDQELALDRTVILPTDRRFGLSGTARVDPGAPDPLVDAVLGTGAPGATFSASSRLTGDLAARASRAFDGDPTTAWSAWIGPQEGQWLDLTSPTPIATDHLDLTVVADGRHSVPTRLRLEADGRPVTTLTVPPIRDTPREGATASVALTFPPVSATHLRLVVDAVRRESTVPGSTDPARSLPVAIAEAAFPGAPRAATPVEVPGECRSDLVSVDGHAQAVRLIGPVAAARTGIEVRPCDAGGIALTRGRHRITTAKGLDTAIDVDRVVLSSDVRGAPAGIAPRGARLGTSGAHVTVTRNDATALDVSIRTDGRPFWLVMGQSRNAGWHASATGAALGADQTVSGYSNGWLVTPGRAGTVEVRLRWTPQRLVWAGFAVSIVAVLVCIAILFVAARRRRGEETAGATIGALALADMPRFELAPRTDRIPSWRATAVVMLAVGLGTMLTSRVWMALVAAAVVLVATRVRGAAIAAGVAAATVLAVGRIQHAPELGWLALALFVAALSAEWLRAGAPAGSTTPPRPRPATAPPATRDPTPAGSAPASRGH